MATINLEGRITRRGFLELSSAALAGAGLMGNANAGKSSPGAESRVKSAKPDAGPLVGKIALEEHFVLAENIDTSYAVSPSIEMEGNYAFGKTHATLARTRCQHGYEPASLVESITFFVAAPPTPSHPFPGSGQSRRG